MIPASYFFRDVYKRSWEDIEEPAASESRNRFLDGLMTPIAGAVVAVLQRRHSKPAQHYGVQAYD